jgi:molecular chaperone GrpE
MDAIRDGLKMILTEFGKAIEELGIEKIDAVGKEFDPNLHEAMANEPSDEVEEGVVIKQWTCGYRMGDRLLRPANVVVSSGSAAQEE